MTLKEKIDIKIDESIIETSNIPKTIILSYKGIYKFYKELSTFLPNNHPLTSYMDPHNFYYLGIPVKIGPPKMLEDDVYIIK